MFWIIVASRSVLVLSGHLCYLLSHNTFRPLVGYTILIFWLSLCWFTWYYLGSWAVGRVFQLEGCPKYLTLEVASSTYLGTGE
jgi:hypothetical protein